MTEDKFENFLKGAAESYNAPPARVPREEMWSAIQAKRAAGPHVVYGGGLVTRRAPARKFGLRVWLGAAAVAVVLVATGVVIGRWTATPDAHVATTLPQQPVVTPATQRPDANPVPANSGSAGVTTASSEVSRNPADRSVGAVRSPARTGVSAGNQSRLAIAETPSASTPGSAYQLTAVRHLSEAEALLTSFRARSTADQQMDAQLGAWARQLLSNTRLLLDSPVADDPQRRPLLEDLELVLVQIVQLSPGSTSQDRELIEKTLQQDHVMTRLRTAIPAGSQRGG
ncbi:MAG TPA: hypothetical protein VGJ62_10540 [Gemmatimonadaceae bacterium]